jgi:hypothetical protein
LLLLLLFLFFLRTWVLQALKEVVLLSSTHQLWVCLKAFFIISCSRRWKPSHISATCSKAMQYTGRKSCRSALSF